MFECLNVFRKKGCFNLPEAIEAVQGIIGKCHVVSENLETVTIALQLIGRYSLQPYDSKIVAAALQSNCTTLYSEDMQHGQVIEGMLTVINQFV